MTIEAYHGTHSLSQLIMAPPSDAFAAYSSVESRIRWCAPEHANYRFTNLDFQVGGTDCFECDGPLGQLLVGRCTYLDIVPDRRIVFQENLELEGSPMTISLHTAEFIPAGAGTDVRIVIQAISLAGPGMISGFGAAGESILHGLDRYLDGQNVRE
jgi:uncharacterized protein YndB with AHSA1/START domain